LRPPEKKTVGRLKKFLSAGRVLIGFTCFSPVGLAQAVSVPMKPGQDFRGAGHYMVLGIQMVVVTLVITGIGFWLDRKTDKSPLFLIVFFILGALGGLAFVWRELQRPGPGGRRG
jgi:FtsH-binding integral membrane protein